MAENEPFVALILTLTSTGFLFLEPSLSAGVPRGLVPSVRRRHERLVRSGADAGA